MIKLQAKRFEPNFLLKLSDLKSNFTLTLVCLNPALNNQTWMLILPLQLLYISLQTDGENFALDQVNNLYLISLSKKVRRKQWQKQ